MSFRAKRYLVPLMACAAALLSPVTAQAQVAGQAPGQAQPSVVSQVRPPALQPHSDVKVPLLDRPLTLADFANMEARPELKDKLGHVDRFIQNAPVDGAPGTEATEAYLGRTSSALYIVFLCFDKHPKLLRSHLARRENILTDDYVTVNLDSFQNRQRSVEFKVNPYGVQADASYTEANGPDYSYDQVWDSEGKVTPKGWMALIVLPFRSLRFPRNSDNWGVLLVRNFPRNSEQDYWPRVAANISGQLPQEGTLHMGELGGITGSHNVQLNPYALAQNEHSLQTLDPNNPFFSTRHLEGTAGGEVKAVLKDSIVIDATVNPDFSDVESDQPQFTVNQRYPVFFPELRPFFLENASYFATPLTLLYTRNIVRPEFGVRVTGTVGHTNVGLLAIDDREPGQTVQQSDPLYQRRAGFFVGRVSRDLGKASNIGVIYTDEEFGGGFNRVGGADFNWRVNDHWTLLGQSVESATKQSRADSNVFVFPPNYSAGPATDVQFQRSGHAFNLNNEYQDVSRGFTTQSGFLQTANIRGDHLHSEYQWYPKHSKLQSFGLETNQDIAFDHANNRVYHYSTFDPFFLLAGNTVIAPIFGQNSDTIGPQNGYALASSRNFTENFGGLVLRGQPNSQFSFRLQALKSGNVNYNPAAGQTPFLLNAETIQALVTINPVRHLTADNTYLLDRDHSARDGAFVYENQVLRTKLNYQFTRAFSARVIVEYDSTLANPLQTALTRTKQVQTQALLTWLPHPGTVIYVGYNNDLQNLNHQLCSASAVTRRCDPNQPILARGSGFLNDGRQFFVKGSYLIRF